MWRIVNYESNYYNYGDIICLIMELIVSSKPTEWYIYVIYICEQNGSMISNMYDGIWIKFLSHGKK